MQDGKIASEKVRGEVYVCPCGYKYFERGVVPFKMVADTFKCPVCGEPKKSFKEQIVEVFCLQLAKYAPLRGIGDE
jgi:rubrerythrin